MGTKFEVTDNKLLFGNAVDLVDKLAIVQGRKAVIFYIEADTSNEVAEENAEFWMSSDGGIVSARFAQEGNQFYFDTGGTSDTGDMFWRTRMITNNPTPGILPTIVTPGTTRMKLNRNSGILDLFFGLNADVINECTTNAGVTIEQVKLENNEIDVNIIRGTAGGDLNLGINLNCAAQNLLDVNRIEADDVDGVGTGDCTFMQGGGNALFASNIDLQTNQMRNMRFVTSGGTATTLDYYESGTHVTTWGNIWAAPQSGDISFTRIGNIVTIFIPGLSANATTVSKIQSNTPMPTRFRPAVTINAIIRIFDNSTTDVIGTAQVLTTGNINISVSAARNNYAGASGSGPSGTEAISLTYLV